MLRTARCGITIQLHRCYFELAARAAHNTTDQWDIPLRLWTRQLFVQQHFRNWTPGQNLIRVPPSATHMFPAESRRRTWLPIVGKLIFRTISPALTRLTIWLRLHSASAAASEFTSCIKSIFLSLLLIILCVDEHKGGWNGYIVTAVPPWRGGEFSVFCSYVGSLHR